MSDELAIRAAALWGIPADQVHLAARRENVVYRADTPDGARALRLHRPGYRSRGELVSEMEWMEALAEAGMRVPHPIPSDNGRLIEMLEDTPISLLSWLPGEPAGVGGTLHVSDRLGFVRELGKLIAKMHTLSDRWAKPEGFTRPHWDFEGLLGDDPLWGKFWENPHLNEEERETLLKAREKARVRLAGIERDLDFGLIHGDILTENVLVDEGRLALIDFDDGAWGFRDFELATFLMRFLEAPDYPQVRRALLDGYATRREVSPFVLEFFILLRAMTYPGWVIPRLGEPWGPARSALAVRTVMPLARKFLGK